jgi:hypothetical protein
MGNLEGFLIQLILAIFVVVIIFYFMKEAGILDNA